MLTQVKRIAQITALTLVLVFGTLLVVGSFDTPVWSSSDHRGSETHNYSGISVWKLNIHVGGSSANYYSP